MGRPRKTEGEETAATDKNRAERLKRIGTMCKRFNDGKWGGEHKDAVQFVGGDADYSIKKLPTGSRSLDWAIGGGWPFGRICELYGPESGGKSTMTLHAIANFQRIYPDQDVALIDSEFSFDPIYAKALGVDVELLIVHQPESGEQALNILESMIDEGVKLIIVDSVAALTTKAELEGEIGDSHVAVQARLMSQALKRLTSQVGRANAILLFTNQLRDNINARWGDKSTTPGGRALKFYASARVEFVRIGSDKEGDVVVSNRVKATVKKNKVAPPFRIANFVITFGIGVDAVAEMFDDAVNCGVVEKSGNTFSFNGEKIAVGRAAVLDALRSSPEKLKEIEAKVQAAEDAVPEKKAKKALPKVEESQEEVDPEQEKDPESEEVQVETT